MNKFICHVGVGFFHRSHQAYCLNRLKFLYPADKHWTFKGVGLLESDDVLFKTLEKQHYQYYTIERISKKNSKTLVNSISNLFCLPKQPSLIEKLNTSDLKAITSTITEKGYHLDENGILSYQNDSVSDDIQNPSFEHHAPKTIYGLLYYILENRYKMQLSGIPIISCDNMIENSTILKKGLLDFIFRYQQCQEINEYDTNDFLYWIDYNMTFPNTMVDRITTNDHYKVKLHSFTFENAVLCEPYFKWVIEDNFINKQGELLEFPNLHKLDEVTYTENVSIYENIKVILLNGSHSLIAYIPSQKTIVSDLIDCSQCVTELKLYMHSISSLRFSQEDIDHYNINTYISDIITRFSNNGIQDTTKRLRLDGGKKIQSIFKPVFQHIYETPVVLTNKEHIKNSLLPIHYYFTYLDQSLSIDNDIIGSQIKNMHHNNKFKHLFGKELGKWMYSLYHNLYNKPSKTS